MQAGQENTVRSLVLCAFGLLIWGLTSPQVMSPAGKDWFRRHVIEQQRPVLVKFTAERCPACRSIEPELSEVELAYAERLKVLRIDVNEHPHLAKHYGVATVPSLILFRAGQVSARYHSHSEGLPGWIGWQLGGSPSTLARR